ncbi:MAG: ERCC4 domain-containing protein [Tetrasphaera sp.]|nr:ERCC4 domain-containing protein [Tetrasphaera sp.]
MPDDFLIARNPEEDSRLPFLVRIPLGPDGIVLKARETWPRTAKVYCHRAAAWPAEPEIVERIATRSCTRRGAMIDLVLDRRKESRSQFVLTFARGREAIFWQTARTTKQARPHVTVPSARAGGPRHTDPVEILVDIRERYAWKFSEQQATTRAAPLAVGDYGIESEGRVVAVVERKSLADLTAGLMNGTLRFRLSELAAVPRAAVVVEDRYAGLFKSDYVRPATLADALAECQARYPNVPIVFTETRKLAQEWTYRFLAAARREVADDQGALVRFAELTPAGPLPAPPATVKEIRAWAVSVGLPVTDRGRLRPQVLTAWAAAHPDRQVP